MNFFYILKIIFDINTSKRSENIKKFKIFKNIICIKIKLFYFLKNIFNINISKKSKSIKQKFKIFKNTIYIWSQTLFDVFYNPAKLLLFFFYFFKMSLGFFF